MLGNTIIAGAYIKTELIDVDSLFANEINANNGTIKNLNIDTANITNANVSGTLTGVIGTFTSLSTTSGSMIIGETTLNLNGAHIRQQGRDEDGNELTFWGQRIIARTSFSFASLCMIEFNISSTTDVYAHISNPLLQSDTTYEKYPQNSDVVVNLIVLKGSGKYTVNVMSAQRGQVFLIENESGYEKYVSMTRSADHWVFTLKPYAVSMFYPPGNTGSYGLREINDLHVLRAYKHDE